MLEEITASLLESLYVKENLLGRDHMEVATILSLVGDACNAMEDNNEKALCILRRSWRNWSNILVMTILML